MPSFKKLKSAKTPMLFLFPAVFDGSKPVVDGTAFAGANKTTMSVALLSLSLFLQRVHLVPGWRLRCLQYHGRPLWQFLPEGRQTAVRPSRPCLTTSFTPTSLSMSFSRCFFVSNSDGLQPKSDGLQLFAGFCRSICKKGSFVCIGEGPLRCWGNKWAGIGWACTGEGDPPSYIRPM